MSVSCFFLVLLPKNIDVDDYLTDFLNVELNECEKL